MVHAKCRSGRVPIHMCRRMPVRIHTAVEDGGAAVSDAHEHVETASIVVAYVVMA